MNVNDDDDDAAAASSAMTATVRLKLVCRTDWRKCVLSWRRREEVVLVVVCLYMACGTAVMNCMYMLCAHVHGVICKIYIHIERQSVQDACRLLGYWVGFGKTDVCMVGVVLSNSWLRVVSEILSQGRSRKTVSSIESMCIMSRFLIFELNNIYSTRYVIQSKFHTNGLNA